MSHLHTLFFWLHSLFEWSLHYKWHSNEAIPQMNQTCILSSWRPFKVLSKQSSLAPITRSYISFLSFCTFDFMQLWSSAEKNNWVCMLCYKANLEFVRRKKERMGRRLFDCTMRPLHMPQMPSWTFIWEPLLQITILECSFLKLPFELLQCFAGHIIFIGADSVQWWFLLEHIPFTSNVLTYT